MSKLKEDRNVNRDRELISRFLDGDNDAFNQLIALYSGKAYQIAFGLLSDKEDAEEVVRDAFVRVYKNLHKFRGDASFSTWLYRIVTNLSRNKYHWHRRRGADINFSISYNSQNEDNCSDLEIPDEKLHPERFLSGKERYNILRKALEQMPSKLKEVIVLRHFDDMSYADIADILGCELGTIKSRLARARKTLKEKFMKLEE